MMSNRHLRTGFSMVEVLLSVAMLSVIAMTSMPVFISFQVRNDLDVATVTIAQSLRRAQSLSQAVHSDTTWGLAVQSNNIVVFKGASYAARDATYDEITTIPPSITPSGATAIVFAHLTGLPQSTGTFTLTSYINEIRNVTINAKGMVSY